MKSETDNMIKDSKRDFYEKMKCQAKSRADPSLYFKSVNKLKDAEKSATFDIRSLFPGKTEQQIGLEVANFLKG